MAIEIEHKFLVKSDLWKSVVPGKSSRIRQGYLSTDPNKSVRIRTLDQNGFVTIKGMSYGAKRMEYEYEIPFKDALELLDGFCANLIDKTRNYVLHDDKTWEVDVFDGLNAGLIIAEIELNQEEETYSKPEWIGEDVTRDFRYSNSNLSHCPFSTW